MNRENMVRKLKRDISCGEIKFFIPQKRYGFITEIDTGEEFFFLRKDAAIKDERLICHLPVTFSLIDEPANDGNRRAILVQEAVP